MDSYGSFHGCTAGERRSAIQGPVDADSVFLSLEYKCRSSGGVRGDSCVGYHLVHLVIATTETRRQTSHTGFDNSRFELSRSHIGLEYLLY